MVPYNIKDIKTVRSEIDTQEADLHDLICKLLSLFLLLLEIRRITIQLGRVRVLIEVHILHAKEFLIGCKLVPLITL